MKKYILIALFLGFSFPAFLQTANAQSFDRIRIEIPFEFSIGGEIFEAGKYTIHKVKSNSEPQFFQLVDRNNEPLIIFSAQADYNAATRGKNSVSLVFKRYGNTQFLAAIDGYSNYVFLEIKPSHIELAKQRKSGTKGKTVVSIALPKI